jgi:cell fate regulator YaaT (PSP1 superfamily)
MMEKYLATYGKPRFLGIVTLGDEHGDVARKDGLIVVASHRGEELAEIVGPLNEEQENEYRSLRTISEHGEGQVRGGDPVVTDLNFVRQPSEEDMAAHESQTEMEDENLRVAQELVEWHKLSIKLIDDEMLLDGKKLFFYFTAEQRVDFRTLVRDLARRFRTRIELRQMGVRDEARIIQGISFCGLPCCCSYWLNQFAPIGIKMVKEQNIALNPSKISGICGRLMCCMSFEHKVYREMWAGLPGPGSKIKTPNGNYIVLSLDIARNAVRCHKPAGGDISVPKDLFADFKQAVMNGEEWEVPEAALEEMNALRKSCSSCRPKSGSGYTDGSPCFHHRSAPAAQETSETPEAEKSPDDVIEAKTAARKRSNRRRGRRGKRPPQEGASALPQHKDGARAPERQDASKRDSPRRQPERAERTEKPAQAAAPPGETARRSRRRRPKRPAVKG